MALPEVAYRPMMLLLLAAAPLLGPLTLVLAQVRSPEDLTSSEGSVSSLGKDNVNLTAHEELRKIDNPPIDPKPLGCIEKHKKCSDRKGKCQWLGTCKTGKEKKRYCIGPHCSCCLPSVDSCHRENKKKKCTKRGGFCQSQDDPCPGKLKPRYCLGKTCSCCIPCLEKKKKCRDRGGFCQMMGTKCPGRQLEDFCLGNCTCCIPSDQPCVDTNVNCQKWANHGGCEVNPDYMLISCPKSCHSCGYTHSVTTLQCIRHGGFCAKNGDHCCGKIKNLHSSDQDQCTCCRPDEKGEGPCIDISDNCQEWADIGECERNPGYMLNKCQRTCKACGCPIFCTKEYNPVCCGTDGKVFKTYSNNCTAMAAAKCDSASANMKFNHNGKCTDKEIPVKPKPYTGRIHCCDATKNNFKNPGCSHVVCNKPLEGSPYDICQKGNKTKGYFFTTKNCHACICNPGYKGTLLPSCHQSICPWSPKTKPHPSCETLTRNMGDLGCCIEYFCDDTTCIVNFKDGKTYIPIGNSTVDPEDPCTTCNCHKTNDCKDTLSFCTKSLCNKPPNQNCKPIKSSIACCAQDWDCTNYYLLMTPKRWAAGGDADVCVTTPNGDNVNVTLEVALDSTKNSIKQDLFFECYTHSACKFPFIFKGVTYNQCTYIEESFPWCSTQTDKSNRYIEGKWVTCNEKCSGESNTTCAVLSIDQTVPPGTYSLSISGLIGDLNISETRDIKIVNIAKTWVQTDKYLYKPNQLVQFRILSVWGPQFQLSYNEIPEVYITSPPPGNRRIAQWLNVTNPLGIAHLNYSLPEEPIEGEYEIHVEFSKKVTKVKFKVEPYTLPKFTVTITPPAYVLATDMEANFTICASYTFGEPVKGYLDYKPRFQPVLIKPIKSATAIFKPPNFDGCQEVTVTPKDIDQMVTSFNVEATVTEEGTGISAFAEHKIDVQSTMLNFEKISKENYYKPGLITHLQVLVTKPDGKPKANYVLKVCVMGNICSNISTNSQGLLSVVLPANITKTKGQRQIPVSIKCYEYFNPSHQKGFNNAKVPSMSLNIPRFYSPSQSYLFIEPTLESSDCYERVIKIKMTYVTEEAFEAKMWIMIIASGRIIFKKQYKVTLDDDKEKLYVKKNYTVIGGELGIEGDSLVRGEKKLNLTLPGGTSNKVKILAFYIRNDSEVVAASTSLNVTVCQRNPAALSWIPGHKQEPGSLVNVTLKAHNGSICSLGVVDRSVELLSREQSKTGKLTLATLVSLLKELEPYDWESQTSDRSYCKSPILPPIPVKPHRPVPVVVKDGRKRKENVRPRRSSFIPPRYGFPYTEEKDAIAAFDDAGVYVLSDFTIETRPCINPPYPVLYTSEKVTMSAQDSQALARPSPDKEGQQREYFPETWLWKVLLVPDSGVFEDELSLPDTITEWVGQGVCVHKEAGLGVSNMASVVTFTRFFLHFTIPQIIKVGEAVTLKISVFNYLKEDINVTVVLSGTGSYSILFPVDGKASLSIGAKSKKVTSMVIRALVAGDVKLTVTACVDPKMLKNCGGSGSRWDTVVREIKVKWEGVEKQITKSGYLCAETCTDMQAHCKALVKYGMCGKNPAYMLTIGCPKACHPCENWQFTVPDNIVEGSARGFITVSADLMGPTIDNLDHLIRMPHGCGEQNMLGFTPNIYVMNYLKASGLDTAAIIQQATTNMEAGYKRELQYRHADASYSAFGSRDHSGSTWLTAFVLKSFAQARQYISVDNSTLIASQKWLESKQKKDGCFEMVGRVIHKDMKGGLEGSDSDSLAPLTSYVLISLLEALIRTNETEQIITEAKACMNNATKRTFYSEALRAYALALSADDKATDVIQSAYTKVISEEERPGSRTSVVIEAMSYVLLAMLCYKPDLKKNELTIPTLVQHITKYSNGEGGFVSTQDTVVALQALAKYSELFGFSKDSKLTVKVSSGNKNWTFNVNANNKLLVQTKTFNVEQTAYNLSVTATGKGCALVSSILRFNNRSYGVIEAFNATISTKTLDTEFTRCAIEIEVCAKYVLPDEESNMAIMEIDLVTGFKPDDTINNSLVKRYEVDDGRVTLYFDSITNETICINFKAVKEQHVENAKEATLTLTDYYDPRLTISKNFAMEVAEECSIEQDKATTPDIIATDDFTFTPDDFPS